MQRTQLNRANLQGVEDLVVFPVPLRVQHLDLPVASLLVEIKVWQAYGVGMERPGRESDTLNHAAWRE